MQFLGGINQINVWYTCGMEYKLQIDTPKTGPNQGDIILNITDIQLHSNPRITKSVSKIIDRSIENDQPGRIYSQLEVNNQSDTDNNEHKIQLINKIKQDPDMLAMIKKYNQQGKRVFIRFPKEGVPVFPGKDTLEFINSKNGKRIIRGIANNK